MRAWPLLLLLAAPVFSQQPDVKDWLSDGREKGDAFNKWTERLLRVESPTTCGEPPTSCSVFRLVVHARESGTLACSGAIHYTQPNTYGIQDVAVSGVIVQPDEQRVIARSAAPADLPPSSYETDCKLAPPPPPLTAIRDCNTRMTQRVNVDDYYPPEERAAGRGGKVFLEFSLLESPGTPSDIEVFRSSSNAALDAAAARYLGATRFASNCLENRPRVAVTFTP
jgi:TonB family protein